MKPKARIKINPDAIGRLQEEIAASIQSKGVQIECPECKKEFFVFANTAVCPDCGREIEVVFKL